MRYADYDTRTGLMESSFIKMYFLNDSMLLRITGQELRLVVAMARHISYDGVIELEEVMEEVSKVMDISRVTIREMMSRLAKEGIVKRFGSGRYWINPDVMFKGEVKSRAKRIIEFYDYKEETVNG